MKPAAPGEEVSQRLSVEGADPLLLAGINDANLAELERAPGARVLLRGDTLTVSGSPEQVERAAAVAQALLDIARIGEAVTEEEVRRYLDGGFCRCGAYTKIVKAVLSVAHG